MKFIPRYSLPLGVMTGAALIFSACSERTEKESSQTATETPADGVKILADGADAKYIRIENMHQARFIEIFLAHRDAKTEKLVAECYNTALMSSGKLATKDTAPQALVEGLDFAKMKQDYNVRGASLNGPKLWLPDWTEIDSGVVRDFNGSPSG